jgi:hypothetical protein
MFSADAFLDPNDGGDAVLNPFGYRELYRIVATVSNRAAPAVTGPGLFGHEVVYIGARSF